MIAIALPIVPSTHRGDCQRGVGPSGPQPGFCPAGQRKRGRSPEGLAPHPDIAIDTTGTSH